MYSSNPNGQRQLAATNGHPAPPDVRSPGESLIAGWPIMRIWCLAFAISTAIAVADAILGHRVILIGLLIVGPAMNRDGISAWACAICPAKWLLTNER